MIDLHTHTNYSDGTWSLEELLIEAEKTKIEVLSITDHDTLDAYYELRKNNYDSIYSGKIITGIEINVVVDGMNYELLGYDFNIDVLKKFVDKYYKNNKVDLTSEFNLMMDACRKNNVRIDNIEYNEKDGWPVDVIYPAIVKHEENKKKFSEEELSNVDVFFNSCITNKNFPVFIDWSIHYPNAKFASDKIREAGGKVFIAHVHRFKLENVTEFLDYLRKNNIIDGIEVYHSSFSSEEISELENYCSKYNLLLSGGSDCHGNKKRERKIGVGYNNLNIPKKIVDNWT